MQGKFFDFRNFAIRREKIVFVTSEIYNGALGGLAGADAKCQERADVARRSGTFKAWLSDRTASVEDRFDRSRDGAAFVRTDGVRVANNWQDLTDGTLLEAITRDEFGNDRANSVWTNTGIGGDARGSDGDCYHWSTASSTAFSRIGSVFETDSRWTVRDAINWSCDRQYRLYCFQQVSF